MTKSDHAPRNHICDTQFYTVYADCTFLVECSQEHRCLHLSVDLHSVAVLDSVVDYFLVFCLVL